MDFKTLAANSADFQARIKSLPTKANRIAELARGSPEAEREIEAHARGTRIIVPAAAVPVFEAFLARKHASGTRRERELYRDMDWEALAKRCIACRPLAFYTASDFTVLRTGEELGGVHDAWRRVGRDDEDPRIPLAEYLSYDEMALSALLGVSVPTRFINAGDRDNCGRPGKPGTFAPYGIYVALVGPRFEVPGLVEHRYLLGRDRDAPPAVHEPEWRAFYDTKGAPHELAACRDGRYLSLTSYRKRMRATFDVLLGEACARAGAAGTPAHIRVVGLGLGVWAVLPREQTAVYVDELLLAVAEFPAASELVAVLELTWIDRPADCRVRDGDRVADVVVRFTRNPPAAPVDPDHVLVATYAWDGNAFPGNEYWLKSLTASGDPAAACCSTIAELQNPLINTQMLDNVVVHQW
ncbi:hypothetical protein H9P43_002296 [Blastocladiella emersonii ATCC 22665]|nr:hypothetical protein H9P43_002296 [Blastocladiella emersonii ATCC 22665]